jgi:hypothetical protein
MDRDKKKTCMAIRRITRAVCVIACTAALFRCNSQLQVDGGFGSETTNGKISGKAVLPDGSIARGVLVVVRKTDYVTGVPYVPEKPMSPTMRDGFTDANGNFVIDSLDTGDYRVELNNRSTLASVRPCSILSKADSVDLGPNTLSRYAAIRGEVNTALLKTKRYVQVLGLERLAQVDSNGVYEITDLPPGTFTLRIVGTDSAQPPRTIDNISCASGSSTEVPAVGWTFSKKLVLNTSSNGANVAGTVFRFPVLVRLTNSNFIFSQAKSNGEDIRFMKADSSAMLPCEIETWDSANGQAAIWVSVDTVHGNNTGQAIFMEWGAAASEASTGGAAVFSNDKGFSGVWHLHKSCADASSNARNGTAFGTADTVGMVGYGKKLNGSEYIKIPGQLGTPASITLSAWARLDSVPNRGGEIISLGDAALLRLDDSTSGGGTYGSVHLFTTATDTAFLNVFSGKSNRKTGWHYFNFTVDNDNNVQAVYIDGTLARLEKSKNAAIEYKDVGTDTYIGKHGFNKNTYNFIGTLDEIRVHHVAVSADWVKLCYMNQKPGDALVQFR